MVGDDLPEGPVLIPGTVGMFYGGWRQVMNMIQGPTGQANPTIGNGGALVFGVDRYLGAFSDIKLVAGVEIGMYLTGWERSDDQGKIELTCQMGLGVPFLYFDFQGRFSSGYGGFLGFGIAGQIGFGG